MMRQIGSLDTISLPLPIQLLLACLSMDNNPRDAALLAEASQVNWSKAVQLSIDHRVAALLYDRLQKRSPRSELPPEAQQRLRNSYLVGLAQNAGFYKEIEPILIQLNQAGIPVIPLKGIYLAEKVYTDVGLRPMIDIDLLIQRPNLAQALVVLQEIGYQSKVPFDTEAECRLKHHLPVLHKEGAVYLEIHWTLLPLDSPFNIPIDRVWQAAHPGTLAGIGVFEPAPEHLLVHLCLNDAYLDYFSSGLLPFCDIALTVQTFQHRLDYEKLASEARAWGAARSVFLALKASQQILGARLPEDFLDSIQPAGFDPIFVSWAIAQTLQPTKLGPNAAVVMTPHPWPKRIGLLFRRLFPQPKEIRVLYPNLTRGPRWLLAYPVHLWTVFLRNRLSVLKLLQGDPETAAAVRQRLHVNQLLEWQAGSSSDLK